MRDSPKLRRGLGLLLILGALGLAALLVLNALRDYVVFFYAPSEIHEKATPNRLVRLGGLVVDGSIQRRGDEVHFMVSDGAAEIEVVYAGILPDLFREGQGIISEGKLVGKTFHADNILAKHDETYMPAEVAAILKEQGIWKGQE